MLEHDWEIICLHNVYLVLKKCRLPIQIEINLFMFNFFDTISKVKNLHDSYPQTTDTYKKKRSLHCIKVSVEFLEKKIQVETIPLFNFIFF
jgi:hypothetical protein